MNYFEKELSRIAEFCEGLRDAVLAGSACYGDLGGGVRVKLQFAEHGDGCSGHYDALKATVISRTEGFVDSVMFSFGDVWGKKYDVCTHGGVPHILTSNGESEWDSYYPSRPDMKRLAAEVGAYIGVFDERTIHPEIEQARAASKGRGAKKPIAERLDAGKQKSAGQSAAKQPAQQAVHEAPRRSYWDEH